MRVLRRKQILQPYLDLYNQKLCFHQLPGDGAAQSTMRSMALDGNLQTTVSQPFQETHPWASFMSRFSAPSPGALRWGHTALKIYMPSSTMVRVNIFNAGEPVNFFSSLSRGGKRQNPVY